MTEGYEEHRVQVTAVDAPVARESKHYLCAPAGHPFASKSFRKAMADVLDLLNDAMEQLDAMGRRGASNSDARVIVALRRKAELLVELHPAVLAFDSAQMADHVTLPMGEWKPTRDEAAS